MIESTDPSVVHIDAIHPHWQGRIALFEATHRAFLLGSGSWGGYQSANERLEITWDNFSPDVFIRMDNGVFLHESIAAPPINRVDVVEIGGRACAVRRINVAVNADIDVGVRINTTDAPTFEQIFVHGEYESESLPATASSIVDLGANVGYAAVFFALRYPKAKILSVEPDPQNFLQLKMNTVAFGDRIALTQGAVWRYDGVINLQTENESGEPLGAWGVQVSEFRTKSSSNVDCYKVSTILARNQIDTVDIMKIDVEGAERELFGHNANEWLSRTNLIIIETHDRFCPGAEDAVRSALAADFQELPRRGENLFFQRRKTRTHRPRPA
jgi:FkbM family methyltransferase